MNQYSEDQLVEQTAIEIFKNLNYDFLNCMDEKFGEGGTLGRQETGEVVLVSRLRGALRRLNPNANQKSIDFAVEEITRDRSVLSMAKANKEIYDLIKSGVDVKTTNEKGDIEEEERIKIIDFEHPENNDFFLASQFWITGEMYKRRADLIGFVNGLPLVFVELKATHRNLKNAFDDNLTDYKDTIPQLFWYNAIIILSNGTESKVGSMTGEWEHFAEWKKINNEGEEGVVSLDTIIRGMCEKNKFLDILENFILFNDIDGKIIKIIAKNHQYLGVNKAIENFSQRKKLDGKLGVFWHTQGSGKSFSMIFFSQKILRKFIGNYTFLIVTDRRELDKQIYQNFQNAGAVYEEEVHADSCKKLQELLKEDHRNIFTLIHKFQDERGKPYPKISDRDDIIVMTDEAHRTQYDILAHNMRIALPNANFIGFTGTPLMDGEQKTREVFGEYVSVYDFKQSVEDKATVPLYYENRIPQVQLSNENLNEEIEDLIERAMLDEKEEEKLEQELGQEYHIITREDRLEKIAADIVDHYVNRGFQGKAMVVSIDKITAVRMYDKVQNYWKEYLKNLKEKIKQVSEWEKPELEEQVKLMQEIDMAVVVSQEQNEVKKFKDKGLDFSQHRRRLKNEDLAKKFQDPKDNFRLAFVCNMWLTGFDVPSLSTMYLDKPMKNHTLMQTIARANRVFEDKDNGLIVDYVGIFRNLQKALSIYTTNVDEEGASPIQDKGKLAELLRETIMETEQLLKKRNIDLGNIILAAKLEKIKFIQEATDTLVAVEESKKEFQAIANVCRKLYKAMLPDKRAKEFYEKVLLIKILSQKIQSLQDNADISVLMNSIEKLLDESIEADSYIIADPMEKINLSEVDFDKLREKFKTQQKHALVEQLKTKINAKLKQMARLNSTRLNFIEKFEQMIEEYNAGRINIEALFEKLVSFTEELNQEEKRHIFEELSEEELAVFDLIKKDKLTKTEEAKIKKVAKDLVQKLNEEKLALDWKKKQQTRAMVRVAIQNSLFENLPEYSNQLCMQKAELIYRHVYDSYAGVGVSVYN